MYIVKYNTYAIMLNDTVGNINQKQVTAYMDCQIDEVIGQVQEYEATNNIKPIIISIERIPGIMLINKEIGSSCNDCSCSDKQNIISDEAAEHKDDGESNQND